MKEERKRLQTELRAKIKKSSSNRCVPEIEHLIEAPHVFELPEHTVTISAISDDQFRDENVFLGNNSVCIIFVIYGFNIGWNCNYTYYLYL